MQLCNILIEGATKLIKWENMMEEGDKAAAEAEIEAMVGASASAAAVTAQWRSLDVFW